MKNQRRLALYLALFLMLVSSPAKAMLKAGDQAPDFAAEASLDGKIFTFDLAKALQQGPVVLYFYPAAFTKGCTIEAHNFAEAMDDFHALGATVVGVSHDSIETLNKFSVSECRSKFAVVADTNNEIMKAYDAALLTSLLGVASRTSYVIAPDYSIVYSYTAMSPDEHVANVMQALRTWRADNPPAP